MEKAVTIQPPCLHQMLGGESVPKFGKRLNGYEKALLDRKHSGLIIDDHKQARQHGSINDITEDNPELIMSRCKVMGMIVRIVSHVNFSS